MLDENLPSESSDSQLLEIEQLLTWWLPNSIPSKAFERKAEAAFDLLLLTTWQ